MPETAVVLRDVPGTEAALGGAGSRALAVDRVAGRLGLGSDRGELLAFAIGGGLCNDLHDAAHAEDVALGDIAITGTVRIDGTPPVVREAAMRIDRSAAGGGDAGALLDRALDRVLAASIVLASVRQGLPVAIDRG